MINMALQLFQALRLLIHLSWLKKNIKDVRIVVNGAGAAAIACANLYIKLGADPKNVIMADSKGVISVRRKDLNSRKLPFATSLPCDTLQEALKDADVFLGLSVAGVLTPEMILSIGVKSNRFRSRKSKSGNLL